MDEGWSGKLHRHHAPFTGITTWKCSFCSGDMYVWFPAARLVREVASLMNTKVYSVGIPAEYLQTLESVGNGLRSLAFTSCKVRVQVEVLCVLTVYVDTGADNY